MESDAQLPQLGVAHSFGLEAHSLGGQIDLGRLVEHVDLVKSVHNVDVYGEDAVLGPVPERPGY